MASHFMDDLDAKIKSAAKTLSKLEQDADIATSIIDTTTALSVEIAATSYTALLFEEIEMFVCESSTDLYPHSPHAPGSDQKESINSKVHLREQKWKEVLSLGAAVGVDVEKIDQRVLTFKRKACDISFDGNDTDCDHGQSIRASLREYDTLMSRKGQSDTENKKLGKPKFSRVLDEEIVRKLFKDQE